MVVALGNFSQSKYSVHSDLLSQGGWQYREQRAEEYRNREQKLVYFFQKHFPYKR